MEINKQDDYSGASNFEEIDDFNFVYPNVQDEDEMPIDCEEVYYRKLDEY